MIVEARTPGTVIYGTPAQFRRAAARAFSWRIADPVARQKFSEPEICAQAIDAMADSLELELYIWGLDA